ncbi:hypothetical protein [Sphingobacterium pedocola]|uniref:hypothetical protein n=1 Tax=Sphingobacterium pedocola TaxID=2082722 RepID=UPI0018CAA859|nr:hypothetical protein [Sphingobacterium pedocola]
MHIIHTFFSILIFSIHISTLFAQDIDPDALYKIVSPSGYVFDNRDSFEDNATIILRPNQKGSIYFVGAHSVRLEPWCSLPLLYLCLGATSPFLG